MTTTILQIVQDAAAELGLSVPTAAVTATDLQTQQLVALANRCGRILMVQNSWSIQTRLFVINLVAPLETTGNITEGSAVVTGIPSTAAITPATYFSVIGTGVQPGARVASVDSATQITMDVLATATGTATALTFSQDTFAQPADFHDTTNRTQWDRTNHWELQGAISPQQYQWLVSGIVATGPRRKYRIQGSAVVIWPPPGTTDTPGTLTMEYMSSYWVLDAAGTPKARFTLDTDTTIFDPDLMVMGLKWLFFQVKGFEYTELRRQWMEQVSAIQATDSGSQTLDMTGRRWPTFITSANVQDADFPG